MSIETSRILGGVGAVLMFIGVLPYVSFFGVLGLVGLILVMVALHSFASSYGESGIFNNALYGLIVAIVGGVVSIAAIVVTVLSSLKDFLYTLFPDWNGDWTALSGLTPDPSNINLDSIINFLPGIFATLLVLWLSAIIAAFLVRRSLGTLSAKSGVGLFSTTGLLLLIGAVLVVVLGIGLVLVWISALLLAIAFFQMKPEQTQPTASSAPPG